MAVEVSVYLIQRLRIVEGAVGEERRPWTNFMEDYREGRHYTVQTAADEDGGETNSSSLYVTNLLQVAPTSVL